METITCAKELAFKVFFYFTATSKKTSMPMGNQNGWLNNLIHAPPYINN